MPSQYKKRESLNLLLLKSDKKTTRSMRANSEKRDTSYPEGKHNRIERKSGISDDNVLLFRVKNNRAIKGIKLLWTTERRQYSYSATTLSGWPLTLLWLQNI